MYAWEGKLWWVFGLIAIFISQLLIISFWKDAKFGTVANLIILIPVLIGLAHHQFQLRLNKEKEQILNLAEDVGEELVSQDELDALPATIQNWMIKSGMVGRRHISTVELTQRLQLQLKPDQDGWYHGSARQWFTVNPPAFIWTTEIDMNAVLGVVGRDKFEKGNGEMLIKMNSIFAIADAKDDPKIDEATLQRFLAEIVWFPSAALSPYVTWESINDKSAKATMKVGGTEGSGIFFFNGSGDFERFETMRYNENELRKWTVEAKRVEERDGIRIPVQCEAKWQLDSGEWTWLKLEIEDISYH
jgi:hypothetical protein